MTHEPLLATFFHKMTEATDAADAVDGFDGVEPELLQKQTETAKELINFCVENAGKLLFALAKLEEDHS